MHTSSFYGTRTSRYGRLTRYIVSRSVPQDGNDSTTGQDTDNEGDVVDTQAESESDSDINSESADSVDEDCESLPDDDPGTATDSDDVVMSPVTTGQWSSTFGGKDLPAKFISDHGPMILLSTDARPVDYFDMFFPATLFKHICTETNKYADQNRRLQETTVPELKAFFGLVLAMGIHRLPRLHDYWDRHWVLNVPQFAQIFSRDRFKYLWANLHVVDNQCALPRSDPSHDRLFKVRPVIDKLRDTFAEHYSPGQNVSVDESMVRFKGRSTLKQYLPMKPIKRGFKVWTASCACCGYCLSFQVYCGREGTQEKGLAHRVVTDLVVPLLSHRQHIVHVDNFFTSMDLLKDLASQDIFLCGTYRTNRKGFPRELTDKSLLKSMKRGDSVMRHNDNTTATVWMDKRPVYAVSNAYLPTLTTVKRKNADGSSCQVSCPEIIAMYNRSMGGVDLTDQLKGSYGFNRKSKRWWFRLFFHFFDLAVNNSFILYLHTYRHNFHPPLKYRPLNQLQFRCQLADSLVNHFTSRKPRGPRVETQIVSLTPSGHKIQDLRKIGITRGRCEYCTLGNGKTRRRKETVFGCPKCRRRLCPVNCWQKFHDSLQSPP